MMLDDRHCEQSIDEAREFIKLGETHSMVLSQETEDGLMRKCCRRALDLFTAEGNVQGTGGARCGHDCCGILERLQCCGQIAVSDFRRPQNWDVL